MAGTPPPALDKQPLDKLTVQTFSTGWNLVKYIPISAPIAMAATLFLLYFVSTPAHFQILLGAFLTGSLMLVFFVCPLLLFFAFQRIRIDSRSTYLSYAYLGSLHFWRHIECAKIKKIIIKRATGGGQYPNTIRRLCLVCGPRRFLVFSGTIELLDSVRRYNDLTLENDSNPHIIVSPHFEAVIRFVYKVNPAVELGDDIEHYRSI